MRKILRKLRTAWRLWLGFCPDCNSDAPEVDHCYTCEGYRTPYPPSKETKAKWISRHHDEGFVLRGGKEQAAMLGKLIKEGHRRKPQHPTSEGDAEVDRG